MQFEEVECKIFERGNLHSLVEEESSVSRGRVERYRREIELDRPRNVDFTLITDVK